jgi:ferric-dicitrate binding protein FerR (iron transport regulator)
MTMNCAKWEEKLNADLDGELSGAERAPLEAHLAACADCRRSREALQAQGRELEALRLDSTALEDRIIAAVHAEPRRRAWRVLLPLAAAAAVVIVACVLIPTTDGPATQVPLPPMTLQVATGPVEIARGETWVPLCGLNPLPPGSRLRTAAGSKCEIACSDGSTLRLDHETEIRVQAPRRIQLRRGELFASVSAAREPFRFTTDDADFSMGAGVLDVSCRLPDATSVAVLVGQARAAEQDVSSQSMCTFQKKLPVSTSTLDSVLQTRWIHELLKLRDPKDPELTQRVTSLLVKAGQAKTPELYEREIRGFGERAAPALIATLTRAFDSCPGIDRRNAARLLVDLAGPSEVEPLVTLARDVDSDVARAAHQALLRITRAKVRSPDEWESWFRDNRELWGPPKK